MNQEQREQAVLDLVWEYRRQIEHGHKDHAAGMARVLDQLGLTLIEPGDPYEGEPGLCPDEGYHIPLEDLDVYSGDYRVMRLLIQTCRSDAAKDTAEGHALERTIKSARIAYVFMGEGGIPGIQFWIGSGFTVWQPTKRAAV